MLLAFQKSPPVEARHIGDDEDGIDIPADAGGIAPGKIMVGLFNNMEDLEAAMDDADYLIFESTKAEASEATVPCPSSFSFKEERELKTPKSRTRGKTISAA